MPKKQKSQIVENVLAVIRKASGQNWRSELRVVRWVIDGKEARAKLEKRSYRKGKDGNFIERGKCVGFDGDDWKFLLENHEEVNLFFK